MGSPRIEALASRTINSMDIGMENSQHLGEKKFGIFLKKLNINLLDDPAIALLEIYPKRK